MTQTILYGFAGVFLGNAALMWGDPQFWFQTIPGVAGTGGFNAHFIRDIALVFLVSAAALFVGARNRDVPLAAFGAAWPCLHALYHIWIWIFHRDTAFDAIALTNLIGIQLPAWGALSAALHLSQKEALA
ncbi:MULTISPECIES: hypothetical protein [unclassified Shimia]|uniref:hypothetical protein n=1 Tax=unclassified Shimia TaxID=2630038 RepID=UPI0031043832